MWLSSWLVLMVVVFAAFALVVFVGIGSAVVKSRRSARRMDSAGSRPESSAPPSSTAQSQLGLDSRAATAVSEALDQARPAIIEELAEHGVVHVEYVVGFVHPFRVSVWLGTRTDMERDSLPNFLLLRDRVSPLLADAGLPAEHVGDILVTAQSQQTLDRDFDGSWFYALR